MRTILTKYKRVLSLLVLLLSHTFVFSQSIGNKVSMVGTDGRKYTGVIKTITNGWYRIKYDEYDALRWFKADQFNLINTDHSQTDAIGKSVRFAGTDSKMYTGIIKDVQGNKYLIKYDGYEFESWLDKEQFSMQTANTDATITPTNNNVNQTVVDNTQTNAAVALKNIFDFGNDKGWGSTKIDLKYEEFTKNFSDKDFQNVLIFLQKATTPSAQFFALKSLLTGDSYETVADFIIQLNNHDEAYQQENCLVTNLQSIIQQWQFSCSVTLLQTYLADLCPRYAWEVKKIANFDKVTNDPESPMAQQQKQLLEKYGGVATPRGDVSGTPIGILIPLNELVGAVIGVTFYAQDVNEPLPVVFEKIRAQLDKGINTPLLIGFTGTTARHFILAMRYQKTNGGYKYLIYDPWDGKCDYVNQSSIEQGSLHPMLAGSTISLDYYYPVN